MREYSPNPLIIPDSELQITQVRSGGAGGQHVNRTASKVQLRWNVARSKVLSPDQCAQILNILKTRITAEGDLILTEDASRSAMMNREAAKKRLHDLIRRALIKRRSRKRSKVSYRQKVKRLEGKRSRGATKALRGRVRGSEG